MSVIDARALRRASTSCAGSASRATPPPTRTAGFASSPTPPAARSVALDVAAGRVLGRHACRSAGRGTWRSTRPVARCGSRSAGRPRRWPWSTCRRPAPARAPFPPAVSRTRRRPRPRRPPSLGDLGRPLRARGLRPPWRPPRRAALRRLAPAARHLRGRPRVRDERLERDVADAQAERPARASGPVAVGCTTTSSSGSATWSRRRSGTGR